MDCMNIDPSKWTFCTVNAPCEGCPRFADDCDGDEKYMEHPEEWYEDELIEVGEEDGDTYYASRKKETELGRK